MTHGENAMISVTQGKNITIMPSLLVRALPNRQGLLDDVGHLNAVCQICLVI